MTGDRYVLGRADYSQFNLPTILEENQQQGDSGSDSNGDPRRWSFVDAS